MLRNGYALVLNVGLTAGLGVTFWVVAARQYSVADVGRGSAMVSALITLSTLGQLNVTSGLIRFLPPSGRHATKLVQRAYAVGGLFSVLLAAGFILLAPRLSPGLAFLPSRPLTMVGFCAAVLVWSVFALQDAAITGLRRAVWIPLENGVYGALKLVLLVLLADAAPGAGVFVAWVVGAAVILLPVNLAVFRRWLPAHHRTPTDGEPLPRLREVGRFLAADYVGSACYLASTSALPLLVVSQLGAVANGYFYVAWTVASSLDLVSVGLTQSLTVEASLSPRRLSEHLRSLLPRLAVLQLCAAVAVCVGAPLLLSLYGSRYAAAGGTAVRLLVLGVLPRAVIVASIAVARVRRHVSRVLAIQAGAAVSVLTLSLILARPWGIAGIGAAWLISQTALACVLLPSLVRQTRARPATSAAASPQVGDVPQAPVTPDFPGMLGNPVPGAGETF